jgi:hypothetical protein
MAARAAARVSELEAALVQCDEAMASLDKALDGGTIPYPVFEGQALQIQGRQALLTSKLERARAGEIDEEPVGAAVTIEDAEGDEGWTEPSITGESQSDAIEASKGRGEGKRKRVDSSPAKQRGPVRFLALRCLLCADRCLV